MKRSHALILKMLVCERPPCRFLDKSWSIELLLKNLNARHQRKGVDRPFTYKHIRDGLDYLRRHRVIVYDQDWVVNTRAALDFCIRHAGELNTGRDCMETALALKGIIDKEEANEFYAQLIGLETVTIKVKEARHGK